MILCTIIDKNNFRDAFFVKRKDGYLFIMYIFLAIFVIIYIIFVKFLC